MSFFIGLLKLFLFVVIGFIIFWLATHPHVTKMFVCLPYLIYRKMKDKKNINIVGLYGIYGYFGLAGKGKTMAMCHRLRELREEYGDSIYITTNFGYKDEDFPLTHWKDLLKPYDKNLVVAYDELPNEFSSRQYRDFPMSLFSILTQVRKGHGIQILYTAQRWHFVDKNFRSLSFGCYECNTKFGCYTVAKRYDPVDYDNLCSQSDYDRRRKIKPEKVVYFIQDESLRDSYNSFKMLESAKSKEYMSREEMANIYKLSE